MKILIIDNYDSFTYNLYQLVGEILEKTQKNFNLEVATNDKYSLQEIKSRNFDKIIISPGPGTPEDKKYFGVCGQVIKTLGKFTPIFGVCLGMQGICHFFGGKIIKAKTPMHGKTSLIFHNGEGLFQNISPGMEVMRYHSLIADPKSLPEQLEITAISLVDKESSTNLNTPFSELLKLQSNFEIMGLKHKKYPICGVQFHPESFATEAGSIMIGNFLDSVT